MDSHTISPKKHNLHSKLRPSPNPSDGPLRRLKKHTYRIHNRARCLTSNKFDLSSYSLKTVHSNQLEKKLGNTRARCFVGKNAWFCRYTQGLGLG